MKSPEKSSRPASGSTVKTPPVETQSASPASPTFPASPEMDESLREFAEAPHWTPDYCLQKADVFRRWASQLEAKVGYLRSLN